MARSENPSLTRQSLFLIFGKFFSLPVTFFIPVVLTRYFSIDEFGQYKQLFVLFALAWPCLDFGITQGLIYFLPREKEKERDIIFHFLFLQMLVSLVIAAGLYLFRIEISVALSGGTALAEYMGLLSLLLIVWALSGNLEIFYTAKKQTAYSGLFIFFSDGVKGLFIIGAVIAGGDLATVLQVFLVTGGLRLVWMIFYMMRYCGLTGFAFSLQRFRQILLYSFPLGIAVATNSFIEYSHQIIVSSSLSVSDFALYSIGCFQIPIIGVMTMSVAQVVIVQIGEIEGRRLKKELERLLTNSFRKLSLLFIPAFIFLVVTAPAFIETLYTARYLESVSVFRVFICILPLSGLLVEYLPRALGEPLFNVKINLLTLMVNIVLAVVFLRLFGIGGAALGFVASTIFRKICVGWFLKRKLDVNLLSVIPAGSILAIAGLSVVAVLPGLLAVSYWQMSSLSAFTLHSALFVPLCLIFFWFGGVLAAGEKELVLGGIRTMKEKTLGRFPLG